MLIRAGRTGLLRPPQCLRKSSVRRPWHGKTVIMHARKRSPQSDLDAGEVSEQQQPETAEQPAVVRSSRSNVSSRRSVRDTRVTKQLVTPHQALREMGIIAVDEQGKPFVDVSCLGRGELHWYAIGLLENKEPRFLELLGNSLEEYGLTHDFSKLYEPPASEDTAAAAAANALLQEYDVVAWTPKKTAWVYSHNLDRLVQRDIRYGRGTGGGTLLLHMRLDPLLVDVISNTYYFLAWRHEQEVSARLLYQAQLLPNDQELDEVFKLPVPCPAEFLAECSQWQHTEEREDEDAMRKEFYGLGGGSTFGESERYDKDKKNLDKDEDGNTIYNQGYAGNYNNPNRWSSGPSDNSNSTGGRGRGRGRGRDSGRGRQQQQQQQQWDMQPAAARGSYIDGRGSYDDGRGIYDDGGRYGYNSSGRGRGRGRQQRQGGNRFEGDTGRQQQRSSWSDTPGSRSFDQKDRGFDQGFGGKDPSVRQRQMQWMEEMGSGRYSDGEGYDSQQQPGQRHRGAVGGRDDNVRVQQMDLMKELGSGRYSDEGSTSTDGSDDEWLPGRRAPRGDVAATNRGSRVAAAAPAGKFGGKGDSVRLQQMDYMEEMGSHRYSDDNRPDAYEQRTGRTEGGGAIGGRDDNVRVQQMDWMGELGSGRYSDLDESDFSVGSSFDSASDSRQAQRNNGEAGRAAAAGSQRQQQRGRQTAAARGQAPLDAGYAGWAEDADDGAAAAQQLYKTWRQDTAEVIVDSDLKADIVSALNANLASLPSTEGKQQRQQPGRNNVSGSSGKPSSGTAGGDMAAAQRWDANSDAEGFEDGWVDRLMDDGNDTVGLDDVMKQ